MKNPSNRRGLSFLGRILRSGLVGNGFVAGAYIVTLAILVGVFVAKQSLGHTSALWLCTGGFYQGLCGSKNPILPNILGILAATLCLIGSGLFVGLIEFRKLKKLVDYERAFETVGLKNAKGSHPLPIDVKEKRDRSEWLTVKSDGVGIDRFREKIRDLESAFGLGIDAIEVGANPSILRLSLFRSMLPKVCDYFKLSESYSEPYSFIVGQSAQDVVGQCISSLPHLLIAGTTGGGKSVFFKQVLLRLLTSSPRIQMYLFDLKGGVEMNVFAQLPNVEVYKNVPDAVSALKKLNKVMDDRLKRLVEMEKTKVDFERDKLDMIVVGVDEASELYGVSRDKQEQVMVDQARALTDRLTKLARAAGIHVILATQKVLKETIDTKIQENIGGRMVFRMNTLQGSLTVLGNKMAFEIPNVPGRAVWSAGNHFTEVQAPLLSDEDLKRSLSSIVDDFKEQKRSNFEPMVAVMREAPIVKVAKDDAKSVFVDGDSREHV